MLKLAFSSLPCEGWSAEKLIQCCKENGYLGIELREDDNTWVSSNVSAEERKRIWSLFQEAGLTVTDIGSGICVKGLSEDEIDKKFELLTKSVQLAVDYHAVGIRIFLGNFAMKRDAPKQELGYDKIVTWLQRACDYAAKLGKEIWIETHNEFSTGKVLDKLLKQVQRSNCKIIWDVIHPLEYLESPEETLAFLGTSCVHIHVKDGVPHEDPLFHDWKYTGMGEGKVPVKNIIILLTQQGFSGFYSLEWESKWRKELQSLDLQLDTVLRHYPEYMTELYKLKNEVTSE